jgi:dTDP-4-dehydrorhamnose reductase
VTGARGQLGRALLADVPEGIDLLATGSEVDISDFGAVAETIAAFEADFVVNAAAYTAVDAAESDRDRAFAVNATGVLHLARICAENRARLVQISTDYVFDGSLSRPLRPDDRPAPLSVYGASKLAGEQYVFGELGDEGTVIRTSWVYAAEGRNFVTTMLRLMRERGEVRVVRDQIGVPTSAASLARVVWAAVLNDSRRTLHYTDAGVASWYDFAVAIAEEGEALGLLGGGTIVHPIASSEFATAAVRPAFSVLDASSGWAVVGRSARHWRSELRAVLTAIASAQS